jgi:hypothetical protein
MAKYRASGGPLEDRGTTNVAGRDAGAVSQAATQAAGQVAQSTKEQAGEVASEVGRQARDLAGEARAQARDQAGRQRDRAVSGLRTLGHELDEMAERGEQSGVATEIARQLSSRSRDVAGFIEQREPGELLEEVRSFARRRPGVFLVGTALAGVAVGRLTRAAASGSGGQQPSAPTTGSAGRPPEQVEPYGVPATGEPAYPAVTPAEPVRTAAAPGGSAYRGPAYSEPGYEQSTPPQQGRTP